MSNIETRQLTPEAQDDRDEFITFYKDQGCSCHINPPCSCCTHPGNPYNQEEDFFYINQPEES